MNDVRQDMQNRPSMKPPAALAGLMAAILEQLNPSEVWLFGSRARGEARPDSDWDLLAVLPNDSPAEMTEDPVIAWRIAMDSGINSTLLTTREEDLESVWGAVNTLGYDLAREGIRLDVR